MMRLRAILVLSALVAGCGSLPASPAIQTGDLRLQDAWGYPAVVGGTGVVFLTIDNADLAPDRILGGSSVHAAQVELHVTTQAMDQAQMRPTAGIDLVPGRRTVLAPGGPHVMLIGLTTALQRGRLYTLTLDFEHAPSVTIPWTIR